MTGLSPLQGPLTGGDATRRFAQSMARAARGSAGPTSARTPTLADVRASARTLGDIVRDAVTAASLRASSAGPATRVVPVAIASTLRAMRQVNEGTSTVRRSSVALGLDTTSAAAPSRLASTAVIGLDTTTAGAASTLASSTTLGLDVTTAEASSRITSTAEANTMPTSYGVVQPTFSAGTSIGTLSGTYAGTGPAAAATSLTLEITSPGGTINSTVPTLVSVKVTDQAAVNLGTYTALLTTGQALSLGPNIGLSIAFGAGTVTSGATATFTVSNTTPTDVDPNAAFNAGVNVRPRFDADRVVTAGSFTVNGTTVSVLADDSINSVLARIASTVSGITASFSGDKVTIQSVDPSEDTITLANDTSGFLTALNLTGASTVMGNVRDDRQVFSKTTQFAGVTTGAFTINGVSIAVNHTTDSLESVISRINSAGAGVTAAYDSAADKLRLTSTSNSESDIVVAGDTSGFLTAAKLSTGNTVRGNIQDDVQTLTGVAAFSAVTAGSFTINGVAISVNPATQTLQSLITTINASAAGVTASYDAATDKLTLTTTTNSEDDIVVGNDTSGFLTAAKLGGATTVKGNIADDQQVLSKTTQFASVGEGSFVINGQTVAVHGASDSLQTLLTRINAAGAGVSASYHAATDKVVFTPATVGATLVIEGDTSGFLAAASIATGARGARVNAAGAFNATGSGDPLFDPGLSVTAGSFTVNGVAIAVAANDTLNSVLAKITDSQAGVTATFDESTESVRLASKTAGETLITVAGDTSGFLAAVKLDTAQHSLGRIGTAVVADTSRPAPGVASPVADAVAKINDMLDMLARSRDLSADLRVSLLNAVRGAVAAVPRSGLAFSSVDGKERVVMDTASLEEMLAKDRQALDALMSGAQGLPEAVSVALAAATEAPPAAPARPATAVAIDRRLADTLRAARATNELGKLELLNALPLRAPIPARRRVDMFA